jgi:crossover junction endodeoxyribonuclease RuvC
MLILGIDPGAATTGYGFLSTNGSSKYDVLDFGLIETDKDEKPGIRLERIFAEMTLLIEKFKPDVMAIENLFFATNAKTAMQVSQAKGIMIFAAAKSRIEIVEYAPGTIKKLVAGDGRADKKMMQKAVRAVLGARVRSRAHKRTHFDNTADALAVALCHAYKSKEVKE